MRLAIVLATLSVVHVSAQQPSTRQGPYGGFIGGGGWDIPDRCVTVSLQHDCPAPGIFDIHAGWMVKPDLGVMGRIAILGDDPSAVLGGSVRYWPARRLWISGGFGFGALAAGDHGSGVVSGAAGFEALRLSHAAIGAQVEWFTARPKTNQWSNNLSLALTLEWYSTR